MVWRRIAFILTCIIFLVTGVCLVEGEESSMNLKSPEFTNNSSIPKKFTCQGDDINPLLRIEGVPEEAKSLALIVDDPDAPMGMWVHWVLYNIPIVDKIDEDSIPGKQGINDFRREDYGGPCPPSGTHRYFFKIYALDTELGLKDGVNKKDLEKAMEGHILDKAELIGLYKKQ
jgi:hypothetical protein|tara:strand:- start:64 stop:582 length:519 start_codon:yes stop_codon:yes gene_type:complete